MSYRLTLVILCFSKIVERITYSIVYDSLTENKIICEKQFDFQSALSTKYPILQISIRLPNSLNPITTRAFGGSVTLRAGGGGGWCADSDPSLRNILTKRTIKTKIGKNIVYPLTNILVSKHVT